METELQQVRDSSSHQKKRIVDMMTNLMKDLSDIGSSIGSEFKVCVGAISTLWMNDVFIDLCDKKLTKSQFSPTHASTKRR